jgi:hypothetical protein
MLTAGRRPTPGAPPTSSRPWPRTDAADAGSGRRPGPRRPAAGRREPEAAFAPLHDACDAWQELGAPYEAAQVRVLLAGACRQLDDRDRAAWSATLPGTVFEGSARLRRWPASTTARPTTPPHRGLGDPSPTGSSRCCGSWRRAHQPRDRRELSISEKTVERHLGNIFTKLDVSEPGGRHRPRLRPRPAVARGAWGFSPTRPREGRRVLPKSVGGRPSYGPPRTHPRRRLP